MFPTGKPLGVTLAIVRWVNGMKAGVEFIRMAEADQALLRAHVGFADKSRPSAWTERVMYMGISGV